MKPSAKTFQAGSIALVTGGGNGLGRQLCIQLARLGMRVVVTDIDLEAAMETVSRIEMQGGHALARQMDVRQMVACTELVKEIEAEIGPIEWLVNNAGKVVIGAFGDVPPDSWQCVMDTNFGGQLNTTSAVYPFMKARHRGNILFVSSIVGLALQPLTGSYCASKHALVGMASALYADARPNGIHIHLACPGYIGDTDIFSKADSYGYNADEVSLALEKKLKGFISPEKAAIKILQNIRLNRFFIVFPRNARMLWFLYRLAPGWAVRGSIWFKKIADAAKR